MARTAEVRVADSPEVQELIRKAFWDGWLAVLDQVEPMQRQLGRTSKAVAELREAGQLARAAPACDVRAVSDDD